MNSPLFVAIVGSMGTVTLIFSGALFFIPCKPKILPAEFAAYNSFLGFALVPLFLPEISFKYLIISIVLFIVLLLVLIPLRGFSFHTDLSMDELKLRIPALLQCSKPEQSSIEPRSAIFHTDNGLHIIAKPYIGNKVRQVFVTGGFRLKNMLSTFNLLASLQYDANFKKSAPVLFIFSVLLIVLFFVFRSRNTGF
jgi:hypothetical protein